MASYNLINYNYRPSKNIERKILIEILREIYGIDGCRNATYIGLGSIFFVDFILTHKALGIKKMINIESNLADKKRIEYNKPYACINLEWGMSFEVLPKIDWQGKKIIWLDYDTSLQSYMLDDVETIFSNIEINCFYMMSCNATFQKYVNKTDVNIDAFKADFGSDAPFDIEPLTIINSTETPNLIRKMLTDKINDTLNARNAVIITKLDKLVFLQLVFLRYKDGAPMFSFGGIVLKQRDVNKYKKLKSPYVKYPNSPYLNIETPILTNSEVTLMNKYLPKPKGKFLSLKSMDFIPKKSKEVYFDFYRHHPNYKEIID